MTAFLDIAPVTRGHTLVVPNTHTALLSELDPSVSGHLLLVGTQIADAIRRSGLRADGMNFMVAEGRAAGQEVPHAHLHVVPRYPADGFLVDAKAWMMPPPSREELDECAAAIRGGLEPADAGGPTVS